MVTIAPDGTVTVDAVRARLPRFRRPRTGTRRDPGHHLHRTGDEQRRPVHRHQRRRSCSPRSTPPPAAGAHPQRPHHRPITPRPDPGHPPRQIELQLLTATPVRAGRGVQPSPQARTGSRYPADDADSCACRHNSRRRWDAGDSVTPASRSHAAHGDRAADCSRTGLHVPAVPPHERPARRLLKRHGRKQAPMPGHGRGRRRHRRHHPRPLLPVPHTTTPASAITHAGKATPS